jgi:hypothetical protein
MSSRIVSPIVRPGRDVPPMPRAADGPNPKLRHFQSLLHDAEFAAFLDAQGLMLEKQRDGLSLPHSIEMEAAALGAMLMLYEEAVTRGMQRLARDVFYQRRHRCIFVAIRLLMQQRQMQTSPIVSIDHVLVAEKLRRGGYLESIGGAGYLTSLIDGCPSAANIDAYIEPLIELSQLRHFVLLGEACQGAQNYDADPAQIANAVRNCTDHIMAHGWADVPKFFEVNK